MNLVNGKPYTNTNFVGIETAVGNALPLSVNVEERAAANLPASTQSALFTISGGGIILFHWHIEVTTAIELKDCNAQLIANPTGLADVNLCAVLNITNAAIGTKFYITGTYTDAMIASVNGVIPMLAKPQLIPDGTLDLSTSATNTGQFKAVVHFVPVVTGGNCVVA